MAKKITRVALAVLRECRWIVRPVCHLGQDLLFLIFSIFRRVISFWPQVSAAFSFHAPRISARGYFLGQASGISSFSNIPFPNSMLFANFCS